MNTKISIVLPIYNEADNISRIYGQLKSVLAEIRFDHELILVDDGSNDGSWAAIESLCQKDPRVKACGLSRNFGQQIALTAGLDMAEGDAVIMMDADLQHPVEMIPEFINKWQEGYDIVYAVRSHAKDFSFFHNITSAIFYNIFNKLSEVEIPAGVVNFRLMSRAAVLSIRGCRERVRHLVGIVSWAGFKSIGIPYTANERSSGKTKYSFMKRLRLALVSITSFSTAPLHFSMIMGMISSFFALLYIIYALYMKFFTNVPPSGWASILISVLFLGGVQLIAIGILGEYLGKVYEEVKQRPLYIINRSVNISDDRSCAQAMNPTATLVKKPSTA
jgi:dolichol-phosphate mannosyltransferase